MSVRLRAICAVRSASDARYVNSSDLQVDDEEHQVTHETTDGEDLDAEEVRGGDGTPVGLQKSLPRHCPSTQGRGLYAMHRKNALDRRAPEVGAQVLWRAVESRIPYPLRD